MDTRAKWSGIAAEGEHPDGRRKKLRNPEAPRSHPPPSLLTSMLGMHLTPPMGKIKSYRRNIERGVPRGACIIPFSRHGAGRASFLFATPLSELRSFFLHPSCK